VRPHISAYPYEIESRKQICAISAAKPYLNFQKVISLNVGHAPGQTWVRAVEKFRRYEAALHERAEKTKTTTPNLWATKASDRITVPANDERRRLHKSRDTPVGERLRRRRHAGRSSKADICGKHVFKKVLKKVLQCLEGALP
jgi:hypothetical protein